MITDSRKIMVYLPSEQSQFVGKIAEKLERPRSWVIQKAIDIASPQLKKLRSPFSKKWKEEFKTLLSAVDEQSERISDREIENFSVQVVRDYRKKIKKPL